MKFRITMKDPDAVYEAVRDAADDSTGGMALNIIEANALAKTRVEQWSEDMEAWFEYREYLTVEYDTEAKTLRIVPTSELSQ